MKNIVIIGAGPAGLAAAHTLLSASDDLAVTLVEQEASTGGLSKTIEFSGNKIDLGGHRLFTQNERVLAWWNGFKLSNPTSSEPGSLLHLKRKSSIVFQGQKFDYPIQVRPSEIKKLGFARTLGIGWSFAWAKMTGKGRRKENLEQLYISKFGKYLYKLFFEDYTEKVWGRPPFKISADWGNQRTQSLSVSSIVKDVFKKETQAQPRTNAGQFEYPSAGIGELWDAVLSEVKNLGGQLLPSMCVKEICTSNGHITHVVCEHDGAAVTIPADYVISSMPIVELCDALSECPDHIRQMSHQLPYRDMVIVGVSFTLEDCGPQLVDSDGSLTGDMWLYMQTPGIKLGRIQVVNNWSASMCGDPLVLTCEYFCQENDQLWGLDDEAVVLQCIDDLVKAGVIRGGTSNANSVVCRVKKAYPAYWGAYEHMDTITGWICGIDNLLCVGRNGQHRYNNMDHSVLTGFIAGDIILGKVGSEGQDLLWHINTDENYQEEGTVIK